MVPDDNATSMADDPSREEHLPADDRTPEEKEASRARIRAWLARPDVNAFLQELKRLDPKGERKETR